jgi:beta-glucosidase
MSDIDFPQGFLWGASTSAHQIEGGNVHSDWWAWEQAGRVAEKSGAACDSYHRWREDLDLAESLGLSVFRISIEWARVEPERDRFDEEAIAHYAEVLASIHERGMQSMVVLWHFTNPAWLGGRGAPWQNESCAEAFEAYVRRIVPALAPHVDWWATMNETNTYVEHSWRVGQWPPGHKNDVVGAFRAYHFLAQGHRRAAGAIRELVGPSARVGLTHVMPWAHPVPGAPFADVHSRYYHWAVAHHFLDKVADTLDWLGVQYYFDTPMTAFTHADAHGSPPTTDMGWRIFPEGMYRVVMEAWERYHVPILVTENGLADADDAQRGRFILDHLAWLHRAIGEGADVRGYLHWSLIDNFEWAFGFAPRFGLAEVDYETFARAPRPSSQLYARIARENRITAQMGDGQTYVDHASDMGPK